MPVTEIDDLPGAYIRLAERFKALWTFHQFLKGVHQTFLGDVPSYSIEFNEIYDRLREVSADVGAVSPSGQTRTSACAAVLSSLGRARRARQQASQDSNFSGGMT